MSDNQDIDIRKEGKAGRITLNRADALNAMTYDMCMAISDALDTWKRDDEVHLIIIDAVGERAFCAGGDIAELYQTGTNGDFEYGRKFWADEYRVNAKIKSFPKPYVAIMDGIVMGGGVGIAVHGSHRVVTENTLFAMPECGIGLVPDVGGNLPLSRAPGHIGEYLAATGARLKAGDCIEAGIADCFIPVEKLPALIETLCETADPLVLEDWAQAIEPETLARDRAAIDRHFLKEDAVLIVQSLEEDDSEWAATAAKLMRRNCPLSVACAVDIVRQARELKTLEEILRLEYRFTYRSMSHGDFLEGIRAQIIDKDRNPKWRPERLEEVDRALKTEMLSSLQDQELTFN